MNQCSTIPKRSSTVVETFFQVVINKFSCDDLINKYFGSKYNENKCKQGIVLLLSQSF